jgi:class 3 adenylate cyclase/tetratricopeptide (TPR) repeat protein
VSHPCPRCQAENPEGFRYCGACGAPLGDEARFEERKLATVVFADVAGSTSLGEGLDVESFREVMEQWFGAARPEIEAEGGAVEKFIGDAIVAVFGVPTAHDDDPARALRAALRMRSRLSEVNERLMSDYGLRLSVRMGVCTGEVAARGAAPPGEAIASGDTLNVAARLQQAAQPEEILVAGRTAQAARGFSFGEARELLLRGREKPVRVLPLLGGAPYLGRAPGPFRAPLVGRDSELGLLLALLARVTEVGRPHIVTVYGEAGVGKSRLTSEFASTVSTRSPPARIFQGRCLPYGDGVAFWPLGEILKSFSGVLDSDPPSVVVSRLEQALGALELGAQEGTDRLVAAFALTLGVEHPGSRLRGLPPSQVRFELAEAWRVLLSNLSVRGPIVVVLEDLHWADKTLLELVDDLAGHVRGPVMFLATARPELADRSPSWMGGRPYASSVDLEPLRPEHARALLSHLLPLEEGDGELRDRLLAGSGGNPFFLEEIVLGLMDKGVLVRDGDRWRSSVDAAEVVVPDTVRGVLGARMDLLPASAKQVLQAAAVVGRVFWSGALAELLGSGEAEVAANLGLLEARGLISLQLSSSFAGQREYWFKHAVVRDVAYETMPRRERARAHAAVAAWVEREARARRREVAELLAHHYGLAYEAFSQHPAWAGPAQLEAARGGLWRALIEAGERSRQAAMFERAAKFAERALGQARSPVERSLSLELAGVTAFQALRFEEDIPLLRKALEERLRPGAATDPEGLARVCAAFLEVVARWGPGGHKDLPPEAESRRVLELGLANAGERSRERARLLAARSFWPHAYSQREMTEEEVEEGRRAGEEAVDLALALGEADLASQALDGVCEYYLNHGLFKGGWEVISRRLGIVDRLRDHQEIFDTFYMASLVAIDLGRFEEAVELANQGGRRVPEEVARRGHLTARASAYFHLGEWDKALADAAELSGYMRRRATELPPFVTHHLGPTALIHEVRGGSAEAAEEIVECLRKSSARGQAWLARVLLERGEPGEALEALRRAEASERRAYMRYPVLSVARCEVLAATENWQAALGFARLAHEQAERSGAAPLACHAHVLEGLAALGSGDASGAVSSLAKATQGFARLGARWELARARLALAEALQLAGRAEEARGEAGKALSEFERLGDRRRARQAEVLARANKL